MLAVAGPLMMPHADDGDDSNQTITQALAFLSHVCMLRGLWYHRLPFFNVYLFVLVSQSRAFRLAYFEYPAESPKSSAII